MPVQLIEDRYALVKFTLDPHDINGYLKRHTPEYDKIRVLEDKGIRLIEDDFPDESTREFVKDVCLWGRGHRNVKRVIDKQNNTPSEMVTALREGYKEANKGNVADGVARIAKLKWLRISYASKILRCLLPDRTVILDSVIRVKLGYAETRNGYDEFLTDCHTLFDALQPLNLPTMSGRPDLRVCDVEAAIYQMLHEV